MPVVVCVECGSEVVVETGDLSEEVTPERYFHMDCPDCKKRTAFHLLKKEKSVAEMLTELPESEEK